MKVDIPNEEMIYNIAMLVKQGWTKDGKNWSHPSGKLNEYSAYYDEWHTSAKAFENSWPFDEAVNQMEIELDEQSKTLDSTLNKP